MSWILDRVMKSDKMLDSMGNLDDRKGFVHDLDPIMEVDIYTMRCIQFKKVFTIFQITVLSNAAMASSSESTALAALSLVLKELTLVYS